MPLFDQMRPFPTIKTKHKNRLHLNYSKHNFLGKQNLGHKAENLKKNILTVENFQHFAGKK